MAGSHRGGPSFYKALHTVNEVHCLHNLPQLQRLRETHPSTDFVPLFSECKSFNFMDSNNNEQSPLIEKLPIWKNYPPKLTRLEFNSTFLPGVDTLVEYYPKMFSILRHFSSKGNLRGLKAAFSRSSRIPHFGASGARSGHQLFRRGQIRSHTFMLSY